MSSQTRERTHEIFARIAEAGGLQGLLDLLGEEIASLGPADGYLINLLDANGKSVVSEKIRYMAEFEDLEQTFRGYRLPLEGEHLNAIAYRERRIVRVNTGNASETELHVLRYWKVREMVGVPILHAARPGDPPIGVVVLLFQQTPPTDDQLTQVQALLGVFYQCLSNCLRLSHLEHLHSEAQAAVEDNKRLLQFLDEMNSLTSVDKIYELFSAELFRQLPFDLAVFMMNEGEQIVLQKVATAGDRFAEVSAAATRYLRQHPYPHDPSVSGAVYVTMRNEHIFFPNVQDIRHLPMPSRDAELLDILNTPYTLYISAVRYQKTPIGFFALYSLQAPIELSAADQQLLKHLSSFLGTAITNCRLYAQSQAQNLEIGRLNQMLQEKIKELAEQASTDQLTGLFNYRTFEQELDRRLMESQRISNKTGLSLVLLDIDHFKRFNDTHGHAAGNDILAGVAREIGQQIRQTDTACRYGGEEFVVILPKCDLDGARLLAERIRASVESTLFDTCAGRQGVTVSIGCTTSRPGDTQQSLFARADEALYQAKHNGRNQVCVL